MNFTIEAARDDADREACARMMCTSDPWVTLGRTYERCLTAEIGRAHV